MNRKSLFSYSAFFIILIFFLNFIANKLYLYSSLLYFDMIMHFLGGFWLGLFFFWYFYDKVFPKFPNKYFIYIMFGVFTVGFIWELYEIVVNASFAKDIFNLRDTISDLICDTVGGLFSYFGLKKIIKSTEDRL